VTVVRSSPGLAAGAVLAAVGLVLLLVGLTLNDPRMAGLGFPVLMVGMAAGAALVRGRRRR
jgi:hypothetical protein